MISELLENKSNFIIIGYNPIDDEVIKEFIKHGDESIYNKNLVYADGTFCDDGTCEWCKHLAKIVIPRSRSR